jgi:WD40 repeat protein
VTDASPHVLAMKDVSQAAFSPDGRVLMTVSEADKQVHFWDVTNGEEVTRFGVAVTGAVFSGDGSRVLTWGSDHVARVFDAKTGKALRRLADAARVRLGAISQDGTRALTVAEGEAAICLSDAATGRSIGKLEGHATPATAVMFTPDGKRAVSLSGEAVAGPRPSTPAAGHAVRRPAIPFGVQRVTREPPPAPAVEDAPAAKPVAADFSVRVWDLEKRAVVRKIDLSEAGQWPALSKDGNLLLLTVGGATKIYDLSSGQEVAAPRSADEAFAPGRFTGDRKTTLRTGIGTAVVVTEGKDVRPLDGPIDGMPLCYAFSADGARVVMGTGKVAFFSRKESEPGKVYVFEVASGKRLAALDGHAREVSSVAFSPDGTRAATRDASGALFLWAVP